MENNNINFYQELFWHNIIVLKDTNIINAFIEKYCPEINSSDLEALKLEFPKRTISECREFFGTNM